MRDAQWPGNSARSVGAALRAWVMDTLFQTGIVGVLCCRCIVVRGGQSIWMRHASELGKSAYTRWKAIGHVPWGEESNPAIIIKSKMSGPFRQYRLIKIRLAVTGFE